MISCPDSSITHKSDFCKVTGITFPSTRNILQISLSPDSKFQVISVIAVRSKFQTV